METKLSCSWIGMSICQGNRIESRSREDQNFVVFLSLFLLCFFLCFLFFVFVFVAGYGNSLRFFLAGYSGYLLIICRRFCCGFILSEGQPFLIPSLPFHALCSFPEPFIRHTHKHTYTPQSILQLMIHPLIKNVGELEHR